MKLSQLLFLCLVLSFVVAKGQDLNIKFEHISIEQGLTQSNVQCIFQDREGFMWFGTYDGLNKYDGYKIIPYRNNSDDTTSIADNYINTIYEDKSGTLWFGTRGGGLCMYDKRRDAFTTYNGYTGFLRSLLSNNIKSILEDRHGNFWVGTAQGLYNFDRNTGKFVPVNINFKGKNTNHNIIKILEDKGGLLWIVTDRGICKFKQTDKQVLKWYKMSDENVPEFINTAAFNKIGELWIGTNKGIKILDRLTDNLTNLSHSSKSGNSLSDNDVTSILQLDNGFIWVGTSKGGVNRYNPKNKQFQSYKNDPTNPMSLSVDNVMSIFQDRTGNLWVGTSLGGVNKWDSHGQGFELMRQNPFSTNSLSSSQVRCIYADDDDKLWVGTVDGGLNMWDPKTSKMTRWEHDPNRANSLSHNHVRTILKDKQNNFWIGTDGGGLDYFNPKTGKFKNYHNDKSNPLSLPSNNVWKVVLDAHDNLWVGTNGGGLAKLNPDRETFTVYSYDPKNPESLSDNKVTTLFIDHTDGLWIGTFGGGLNRFDQSASTFIHYKYDRNDPNTIGNDRVYSIHEDKSNHLWIGTKGCLNKFNPESEDFIRITEEDGLPNDVVMGVIEDDKNNLWISTNIGLCKFNTKTKRIRNYDVKNGLQSNEFLVGSYFAAKNKKVYFGGINGLNSFYPDSIKINDTKPQLVFTDFKLFNQSIVPGPKSVLKQAVNFTQSIVLDYNQNNFSFEFAALHYSQPDKNLYAYRMDKFDKDWIFTSSRHRVATYTNLDPGTYTFRVIGANCDGVWNKEGISIIVVIEPPIWATWWFRFGVVLILITSAMAWYRVRINRIEKQKKLLEQQVVERTAEVEKQKEELKLQKDALEEQNEKIELKNSQIRSSIRYAQTIQQAILPLQENIDKIAKNFIIYRPKDIVSGDFYWHSMVPATAGQPELNFVATVDCTGHGVPGAFMSMIGSRLLSEIVNERKVYSPADILELLDHEIKLALRQDRTDNNDGMDICLCLIERVSSKEIKVTYSAAKRPLYYQTRASKEVLSIKGNIRSIGGYHTIMFRPPFENHTINLEKGDRLFLTTDGYVDQNDAERKRFGSSKFTNLIKVNSETSMHELKKVLEKELDAFMQDVEQRDDISIICIEV